MAFRFTFRPLLRADLSQVGAWLRQPHVRRWWPDDATPEGLEADYGGVVDGTEPTEVFIVEVDGRDAGLVQRFTLAAYAEYHNELQALVEVPAGTVSIDYFIGEPDLVGRGVGSGMLTTFVGRLWRELPGASCVLVPVNAENAASWRALERAGFRRVAAGEMTPDDPLGSRLHVIYRLDRPASGRA
jgi:aminoglycoside 6'-N-acetyltransferase